MNSNIWGLIANNLQVSGLTKVLVDNCAFGGWNKETGVLTLFLDPVHQPLLNTKHLSRIQHAITGITGEQIILTVECRKIAGPVKKYYQLSALVSLTQQGDLELVNWEFKEAEEPVNPGNASER